MVTFLFAGIFPVSNNDRPLTLAYVRPSNATNLANAHAGQY